MGTVEPSDPEYWRKRHEERPLDFGHGIRGTFFQWDPDLTLNPQYSDIAHLLPVEKAGLSISHVHPDGKVCEGAVTFKLPGLERLSDKGPRWDLISLDPLTISPSILHRDCGLHGFIREGQWIPA